MTKNLVMRSDTMKKSLFILSLWSLQAFSMDGTQMTAQAICIKDLQKKLTILADGFAEIDATNKSLEEQLKAKGLVIEQQSLLIQQLIEMNANLLEARIKVLSPNNS